MMTTEQLLNAAIRRVNLNYQRGNVVRANRWARIANRYFVACYGYSLS